MKIKKVWLFFTASFLLSISVTAQEIVNLVFVGKNGITENIKDAQTFILVKRYPGNIFERLDYKMSAPLTKLRTYSDSDLTVLQGAYFEYYPNGECHIKGEYHNNLAENDWLYYNTDGKLTIIETYSQGNLTKTVKQDTVKKAKDTVSYKDEREANIKGGNRSWINYLQQNLKADVAEQSRRGGSVRVFFSIDTAGNITDIHLKKSVEYVLDEEAIRVIRASPQWIPAFQNGKPLKAYRIQPLTFEKN